METEHQKTTKAGRKGYFTDDEGNPSSLRVFSAFSLLQAMISASVPLYKGTEADYVVIALFLTGAFAPKVFQKYAERLPTKTP